MEAAPESTFGSAARKDPCGGRRCCPRCLAGPICNQAGNDVDNRTTSCFTKVVDKEQAQKRELHKTLDASRMNGRIVDLISRKSHKQEVAFLRFGPGRYRDFACYRVCTELESGMLLMKKSREPERNAGRDNRHLTLFRIENSLECSSSRKACRSLAKQISRTQQASLEGTLPRH